LRMLSLPQAQPLPSLAAPGPLLSLPSRLGSACEYTRGNNARWLTGRGKAASRTPAGGIAPATQPSSPRSHGPRPRLTPDRTAAGNTLHPSTARRSCLWPGRVRPCVGSPQRLAHPANPPTHDLISLAPVERAKAPRNTISLTAGNTAFTITCRRATRLRTQNGSEAEPPAAAGERRERRYRSRSRSANKRTPKATYYVGPVPSVDQAFAPLHLPKDANKRIFSSCPRTSPPMIRRTRKLERINANAIPHPVHSHQAGPLENLGR